MAILKYVKLPFYFDAARLQQAVNAIQSKYWLAHYQKLHYTGGWSAIPLRSIDGKDDNIFVMPETEGTYKNTNLLTSSAYLQEVLNVFQCPLLGARLLKLDAGAVIKEHRDADLAFEMGEVRIHVPVITDEAVDFLLDKERMQLKEGESWYMNFNLPHSIHNRSSIDRIHLVIDAKVNDWIKDLFAQSGLLKKETEEEKYDVNTQLQIIAQLRQMNTETGNKLADEMEASLQNKRV
jgi:Aspartyl/Asparaginyl beta-hydroxylase